MNRNTYDDPDSPRPEWWVGALWLVGFVAVIAAVYAVLFMLGWDGSPWGRAPVG